MKLRLVVRVIVAAAASYGVPTGAHAAESTPGVTATIVLSPTKVRSGATLHGAVVVRNSTGHEVTAIGCGGLFQVALSNASVTNDVGWLACAQQITIPPGWSQYLVTVPAYYTACTTDPNAPTYVQRCGPDGRPPGLPPGKYDAKLYQSERVADDPPPVRVRVVG